MTKLPSGGTIVRTLDGRGRVVERTGPTVEKIKYEYDDANRLIQQTIVNPGTGDQITKYEYSIFDTAGKITDPENIVTRYHFDDVGNNTKLIEAADGQARARLSTNTTIETEPSGLRWPTAP